MQEVMSLEGKTIVVTGAAQGIGQAISNLAIALGARVIGIDLNGDKLNTLAATTSGRLLPYVGNVADPEFIPVPVEKLLDPDYLGQRARLIGDRIGPPPAAGGSDLRRAAKSGRQGRVRCDCAQARADVPGKLRQI